MKKIIEMIIIIILILIFMIITSITKTIIMIKNITNNKDKEIDYFDFIA
jgi:hypothetical protein